MEYLALRLLNIDNEYIRFLTQSLRNLAYVDLSWTDVSDISPLDKVKETLCDLILRRLKLPTPESVSKLLRTILRLHKLCVLDVFNVPSQFRPV